MKENNSVQYDNNKIIIKQLPKQGDDLQVFIRPGDSIDFPVDLNEATYQLMGGDILFKLPDGGTITFVSMGLLAFSDSAVTINFPSASLSLLDILSQVDDVKESPIESVVSDEFVKLNDEYSDTKDVETAPEVQNVLAIQQEPNPAVDTEKLKKLEEESSKPDEEVPANDFDAVYKPTDDNPVNVNISEVNNAVEAGLKFTLTAFQSPSLETVDGSGDITRVDGGGGSAYGSQVDTPEAQFQTETLDYSTNSDGTDNMQNLVIHGDAPKLFKTDPTDLNSESQLARDLSIRPEQPVGFGISTISISNLPDGYKIVGATFTNDAWEVPQAEYDASGNLTKDGFTVDINTGKARFTMTYPDDLLEGEEVTAVINFTSTFDTANLLPGEVVDTPDVTSLAGQGRLYFVTKEIDWESPTGYEGFIDEDERVVLATNPNNNLIKTSHGDATVYGGEGNDTVIAYEGNDTISGANGDDTLDGGAGDDTISGDDGNDTLMGKEGINTLDGGDGIDTSDYSYVTDNDGVEVNLSSTDFEFRDDLGNVTKTVVASTAVSAGVVDNLTNIEQIVGSSKDDIMIGDELANIFEGEDGLDTIYAGDGNDTLDGGARDDTLFGEAGDDTLLGGAHNDTLDGGTGNDTLLGETGDDRLMWDTGDDSIDGGDGSDTMDFDNYVGPLTADIYRGEITVSNSSDQDDIINMEILRASKNDDTLTGGSDSNTIYGNDGDDIIDGNDGNDILAGDAGNDTIDGGEGLNTLDGNSGDDILSAGSEADEVDGGTDIDTMDYSLNGGIRTTLNEGNFVSVSVSGEENDRIANIENVTGSNTGSDTITGDVLVNTLLGQGGNDTLDGAGGDDYLAGGTDDDTLIGGAGDDYLDGGSELSNGDTADYTNQDAINVSLDYSNPTATTTVTVGVSGEIDTLKDIENITGSDDSAVGDDITGNSGENILSGLKGDDTLSGLEGDDSIDAGAGDDTIYGGADQDILKGSLGNDYLEGGTGSDDIDGGSGIDTVSYVNASNGVKVFLDSGLATGEGTDSLAGIENIIGSAFDDSLTGDNGANAIESGDGDDFIFAKEAADTIDAGDGDDTIDAGTGSDSVDGGLGIDTLDYTDEAKIVVDLADIGTSSISVANGDTDTVSNIENIIGSNTAADTIVGNNLVNIIEGQTGNDTLDGDAGDDTLLGGSGNDLFINRAGIAGNDVIDGGDDVDTVDYSGVTNRIVADLTAVGVNVSEDGEGGEDSLSNIENIIASAQADTITANALDNELSGLAGDDILIGDDGNDTIYGGADNDTLSGNLGNDSIDGGIGNDTVDYSLSATKISLSLVDKLAVGEGVDAIENIENVIGSLNSDTITANDDINIIQAEAGNDTVYAGAEVDTVDGSSGDDTLFGQEGDDTLRGGADNDVLHGGLGSDIIDGGTNGVLGSGDTADYSETAISIDNTGAFTTVLQGIDTDTLIDIENIRGSSSDDDIQGTAGDNVLDGYIGNDTIHYDLGNDTIDGGVGSDTMDFTTYGSELVANISGGNIVITGAPDQDDISNIEIINASLNDDTVTGGNDNNTIYGSDGDDTLDGGGGNDIVHGDAGDDTVIGGDGSDTLEGNDGDDFLVGGVGSDSIDGGADVDTVDYTNEGGITTTLDGANAVSVNVSAGDNDIIKNIENVIGSNIDADTITGDSSVNTLLGQGGNDTLDGAGGDDSLDGGASDDTLIGGAGDDFLDGGSELLIGDTADYTDQDRVITTLDYANPTATTTVTVGSGGEVDTLTDIENITGSNTGDDTVVGNSGVNILKGQGGADTLTGLEGDDQMDGGADNDTLYGGADNDTIAGSIGDDYIEGGTGDDIIAGGIGKDTASYENASSSVVVHLGTGVATGDGTDALSGIENVVGSAYKDNITGNDDANIVSAGAQDDTVFGGLGDDTLYGQDGADTLSGGDGVDSLYGQDNVNPDTSTQDMASYKDVVNATSLGVTIDMAKDNSSLLNAKVSNDGYNNVDYLYDIENIQGSDYQDFITGDANANKLLGEAGVDTLYGGAGDDYLDGGSQDDTLRGNSGDDILLGGDGLDTADYSTAADAIEVNLGLSGVNVANDGDGGQDTLVDIENIDGTNSVNADTIEGSSASNVLKGLAGDDTLKGGSGLDTLDGGLGDDTLFGGADADTLIGGDGLHDIVDYSDVRLLDATANGVIVNLADESATGDGNDVILSVEDIRGSKWDDALSGNDTANTIYGGEGVDILSGGAEADELYGEAGDDTISGDEGNDLIFGGDGITDTGSDTADYSSVTTAVGIDANLNRTAPQVSEDGYGTQDTLNGIENISGSKNSDLIKGSNTTAELNILSGNEGADSFIASDGQDSIVGGDGKDIVDYSNNGNNDDATFAATAGIVLDFDVLGEEKSIIKTTASGTYTDLVKTVETVIGTEFSDSFTGGSGDDEFYGRDGDDSFLGNSGADTLVGESGDDLIDGGADSDDLQGGIGDDTIVGGTGDDLIDGGTNANDRDVADYTSAATKIELDLDNSQVIGTDSGTDTITNIEVILATNYEDTLVGDNASNILDGRGANDTILGQDGDDTLIGFNGGDTINGGLGSDVLIGGSDTNDEDTVGFDEVVVNGSGVSDVDNIVTVDLDNNSASTISINRTDTTLVQTYSFNINGTIISYDAVSGDTGDLIIEQLYDAMVAAGLSDIKQLNDISNSPNIDVYETSHRLLIMDSSVGQTGFTISAVTNLAELVAGTASSVNATSSTTEIDYLFDFDNVKGSDINGAGVGDTLTGNSGDNKIYAGEGDDTLFSTLGADYLDGENGADWVDYSNQTTTRVDVQLDAGNGDGTGVDNFTNTLINIENIRGTDAVAADTIVGDANANIIEGGNNNNGVDSNANYETLRGGAGDDTIYGDFIDTLSAVGGRDTIQGNAGDDTLYGGAASDRFYGGADADTYIGGSGFDYVYYNGDDGTNSAVSIDLTTNTIDAHGDIYNGVDIYQEIEYIYGSDGGADTFIGDANDATRSITFNGLNGADTIVGGAANENLIGEDGNDLLTGGAGNDVLSGQSGNDTFFAQTGVDTIHGGTGNEVDTIDFRSSADNPTSIGVDVANGINLDLRETVNIGGTNYGTIIDNGFGENGFILSIENVNTTDFDDIVTGNASKNIVNLYGGDDRVFLSDGADTIYGGSNTDVTAGGGDWVDATNAGSGGAIYLDYESEYMGTPNGKIYEFEHIKASSGDDYMLQGTDGDNSILGMDGDDTLVGRAGDDYLDGGNDSDTASYSESAGQSTSAIEVHYDTAIKTVSDGLGGTDTLVSIETVIGSNYNDTFFGSSVADTFLSGGGQDSFVASLGDDYFSGNEGGVAASLTDYSQLKDAAGTVINDAKLVLDLESQSAAITTASGDFTDTLVSMKNVRATSNDDTLTGSSADNSMYGLAGDDTFFATDGNDTYDGGTSVAGDWVDYSAANTTIISNLNSGSTSKGINGSSDGLNSIEHISTGSNNDTITASSADNIIIANAGNDTVYSNDGDNTFYGDDSTDTTTNNGLQDTIRYDLEDTGSGVIVDLANSTATNAYGKTDALYNFENVIGSANSDNIIGNALDNSILGGAGADVITGGAGSDSLLGASGDDTFKFTNTEFGADTKVSGGDDTDTVEITDATAVTDADFANIVTVENVLLSSDNAHTITLGTNADATGIISLDATAALNSSVTVDVSAMSNDMTIQTSNSGDSVKLGSGTDIVDTYGGADTIEYDSAAKVNNGVGNPSDTINAGNGVDTLFANSGETYDFTQASVSSIETLKFYEGASDQNITISSDQNLEMTTFNGGNVGQVNTLQVETTATTSDVDLTSGKILGVNIDKTVINVNLGISSTLIGNTATEDTIIANSGSDTLSGLGGDDILTGNAGDDVFLDGSGNDVISGGDNDDLVQFTAVNLNINDIVDGGNNNDVLQILDQVTGNTPDTANNLSDTDLTNVTNFETIKFADTINAITLNQDGVELLGGSNVDTFNYAGADFSSADTIDGASGIDELVIGTTEVVNKTLADFANVSNVEELTLGSGNDILDLSSGSNGFNTVTTGAGDDTLSIDANNVWIGKTLDGGANSPTGDTLEIVGAVAVDLSATNVLNFENIAAQDDLSLTVKQVNDLVNIDVSGNVLNIVGNDGDTTMSAAGITADQIKFTSGMEAPTTVNDIHLNIDASGSNQALTMGVNAATDKTAIEIIGSGSNADILNVALNTGENLTNGFSVDSGVETFNLSVEDSSHTLDLTNIATTTTLKTASSAGTNTITVNNATKDVDANNLNANETLSLNATTTAINIIGGLSLTDTVTLASGTTFTSTSGVENLVVQADNDLSSKIATDVENINVTGTLTLDNSDLDTHTGLTLDGGVTQFDAGIVGSNDYSGITLANSAQLEMSVVNNLDISSQGSDNVAVLTDVNIASGQTFTINADQTNNSLDVTGATNTSDFIIKATSTDGNNDFTNITNSSTNSANIIYDIVTAVDKTGEATDILGAIDTVKTNSGVAFDLDSGQLGNINTLDGDGTFNVHTTANTTDLSAIATNTFSGTLNIADSAGADNIRGSSYSDNISISGGADSIDGGGSSDNYIYSGDANGDTLNDTGASGVDKIVVNASADLSSIDNISGIDELEVTGNFSATIDKVLADAIGTYSGAGGTSSINIELTDGEDLDISSKTITSLDSISINVASGGGDSTITGTDSSRNIITLADGINIVNDGTLSDTVTGGSGVDEVNLTTGNDVVNVGNSDDTIKIDSANLTSSDTLSGGIGSDTLELNTVINSDHSKFANVSNIQTLKLADGSNTLDFSTNAGSINIVDGSNANGATDNLTINVGSQVNDVIGGAGTDTFSYDIANLNASDNINGGGEIDTLAFNNAGTITSVGNLTSVEVVEFANGANDITLNEDGVSLVGGTGTDVFNYANADFDASTTAGDIIVGGSASDDELFLSGTVNQTLANFTNVSEVEILTTGAGDDTLDMRGGATGFETIAMGSGVDTLNIDANLSATSLDGGAGTSDTLAISGIVDLSSTTITGFENITADDDLSISVAQADGATITVTDILSIVKNDGSTSMDAVNITAGTIAFTNGITSDTTITNIKSDIDGTNGGSNGVTNNLIMSTSNAITNIKGGGGSADSLTLSGSADVTNLSGVEILNIDNSGLDMSTKLADVTTLNVSNANDVTIASSDLVDVSKTLNQTGDGTINVISVNTATDDFDAITLTQGTLNLTASSTGTIDISGLTITSGDVNLIGVAGSDETFIIDQAVNSIDGKGQASADTLSVFGTVDLTSTTITAIESIVLENSSVVTMTSTQIDGASISGAGVLHIADNTTSPIDMTNISSDVVLDASISGSLTLNNTQTDIDASSVSENITTNVISPMTYITGTGTNLINDISLADGEVVTIEGSNTATVTLVNGDVDASSMSVGITVNDGAGSNVISTGTGNDTYTFTTDAQVGDSIIDASTTDTDVISVTSDADLTNLSITNVEELNVASSATTAIINKAIAEDLDTYSGTAALNDVVQIDLASGEDIDISSKTVTALTNVAINVAGGGDSTIVGATSANNNIALVDGTNVVTLGSGNDTLQGGSGADTVTIGTGADDINTGLGSDTIYVDAGSLTAADTINGGGDTDTLEFTSGGTVSASEAARVFSVENIIADANGLNITLNDNNGITNINGSAITAGNSLVVDATDETNALSMTGSNQADDFSVGLLHDVNADGGADDVMLVKSEHIQGI